MDSSQIITIIGVALLALLFIRRGMRRRSITQYRSEDVAGLLQGNGAAAVLLDVRTQGERNGRHIKGSLHIPLQELRNRWNELERYKDKQIVCYCQSGSRSMAAAALLKKQGFSAANMRGGIAEWNFQNRNNGKWKMENGK